MLTVYLAGPISKCTLQQAIGWRKTVKQSLAHYFDSSEIQVLDPMRGKETELKLRLEHNPNSANDKIISHNYLQKGVLSNQNIFNRDLFDIDRSDILLVNLSDTSKLSVGTLFEMGYAHAKGIKLFVVTHPDSWLRQHPFIEQSSLIFDDLQDCIEMVVSYVS